MSERPEARLNDPDLLALEGTLRRLAPRPAEIDRERLMYRAGQAASPRRWLWPMGACLSTTLALVLGIVLLTRPPASTVERIIYIPVTTPEPVSIESDESGETPAPETQRIPDRQRGPLSRYRRMQEQILYWGLDAVPDAPPAVPQPPASAELLWRSL
jgi:hypothetical protein